MKGFFCFECNDFIVYNMYMIERVVKKRDLNSHDEIKENLEYWLSRPPEERVAAVDYLRKQVYGDSVRLQRVVRVIQRS